MRNIPDVISVDKALRNFIDYERRIKLIKEAGEIYNYSPFYFQCSGIDPKSASTILERVTGTGKVP